MIWFLAGVAAAASMALTIYARLEYFKGKDNKPNVIQATVLWIGVEQNIVF